jgi:alanine racemase
MKRRVTLEIDLGALVRNYRRIARRVRPAKVMCVLKANAYGLGVTHYAKALAEAGCGAFGVAEPHEAMQLTRLFGTMARPPSVQLLSSVLPDEIPAMVKAGVVLPVTDAASARLISAASVEAGRTTEVHLKIDTGMGRLGIQAKDALSTIVEVRSLPALDCAGIFTHCPMAYAPEDGFTARQIEEFRRLVASARRRGFAFRKIHIAASDAINNFPAAAKPPFNWVRTGINLHGSFDPNGRRELEVEPVLTLKTRVAQVRELPAGATLGYGRTWRLDAPAKIATISAGYADGLPLALTNRASVFIGGRRCRIVGRISMDYTTVDVSGVEGVKAGDEVICLGRCADDAITPDDWAELKGTHAYDIICSFGSRVRRTVKDRTCRTDMV